MSTPDSAAEAIKAALFAGNKIEAIKLYREQTKLGLAEAKAAMDALEAELRSTMPDSFTAPPAKPGGCAKTAALVALLGIVAALCVWR